MGVSNIRTPLVPLGTEASVRRAIMPAGTVYAAGEEWTARSADGGVLERGTPVRVVGHDGLKLIVERLDTASRGTGLRAGRPASQPAEQPKGRPDAWTRSSPRSRRSSSSPSSSSSSSTSRCASSTQYERLVVFRLGRTWPKWSRTPAFASSSPSSTGRSRSTCASDFDEIPSQTCITKDNAPIDIDFLIYWRDRGSAASVGERRQLRRARSQGIATTTLRAVIGDIPLDDVLSKREDINDVLRTKLDEVTERWGVKVTTVEIREIVPPRDIQDAMNRQMSAERNRRAIVIESEGKRAVRDPRRRGREAVGDPQGRGRPPGGDPARRGLQRGPQAHLLGGQGHRRPDDGAAVPRRSQGARREGVHEVHPPAGADRPGQAPGRLPRPRPRDGRLRCASPSPGQQWSREPGS